MGSVSAAHLVQFYSGAERLAQSLSSIFADSLLRGETVVVVAGNDHREALDTALGDAGVNLAAEYRSGRYLQVDVDQALDGLMRPKGPDAELFNSTIGDTIDQARRRTGTVNAYGEMVGVLAQRGDLPSALQLESRGRPYSSATRSACSAGTPGTSWAARARPSTASARRTTPSSSAASRRSPRSAPRSTFLCAMTP